MLRKTLVLLTAGMLTLSGCSATPRDVPAAGSRAVTLALSTEKNPFFLQVRYGAQAKANELGIDLTVLDAGDDAEVQAAQLDDVSSGVAVVNPADSEALAPAVSQLNEKGIPAITVDRTITGADVAALIDSNNTEGGAAAASVSHPVKQGLVQALGVYFDTLVVCSATAFIILLANPEFGGDREGITLTQDSLAGQVGAWGVPFLTVVI